MQTDRMQLTVAWEIQGTCHMITFFAHWLPIGNVPHVAVGRCERENKK
jgi:hypothetical protein